MVEEYQVVAAVAALYKDEKMTQKKGKVSRLTIFEVEKKNTEGTMLKTGWVPYLEQETGDPRNGDGWLEASKCVPQSAVNPPVPPATPPPAEQTPTTAEFLTFRKVLRWLGAGSS